MRQLRGRNLVECALSHPIIKMTDSLNSECVECNSFNDTFEVNCMLTKPTTATPSAAISKQWRRLKIGPLGKKTKFNHVRYLCNNPVEKSFIQGLCHGTLVILSLPKYKIGKTPILIAAGLDRYHKLHGSTRPSNPAICLAQRWLVPGLTPTRAFR